MLFCFNEIGWVLVPLHNMVPYRGRIRHDNYHYPFSRPLSVDKVLMST